MAIIAVVLVFASILAFIWASLRQQEIYYTLIDSFPLEFRDPEISRYAFHTIALSPSTPLGLQADYIKTQAAVCFATLGVSLTCFLLEKPVAGWILLAIFFVSGILTMLAWKAYIANRDRRADRKDGQQL